MAFQQKLWSYSFNPERGPNYPCPHCKAGSLGLRKDSLKRAGPYHDKSAKLTDSAFMGMLDCRACDGSAAVVGYVRKDGVLVPKGIYPAPPIIAVPTTTPRPVVVELDAAFALFWVDLSSCANKIRVSLERLLDSLGLPESPTLAKRIESQGADKLRSEVFHALREVGNVGSHGSGVRREVVLTAFEIYEHQLDILFRPSTGLRIETLAKKIRATKGK